MRCPNQKCGRAIAVEDTSCICGWKARAAPAVQQRQAELEAQADPAVRDRAMAQIRSLYRKRPDGSLFEQWMRRMTQQTVNWLVAQAAPEQGKDKCLCRMKAEGVIDEDYRLIPLEKRAEAKAARQAERRAFETSIATEHPAP